MHHVGKGARVKVMVYVESGFLAVLLAILLLVVLVQGV